MARFSTAYGDFVGVMRLPNGIKSFYQAVQRKTRNKFPRVPWIPFSAFRALAAEVRPDWVVWEIGAGNSTLWLSKRVKQITSIEASEEWHSDLKGIAEKEGIRNLDLRYVWDGPLMSAYDGVADGSLDLLFVDGGPRRDCLVNGLRKVKPGGLIYCDNWDVKEFWGDRATLLEEINPHVRDIRNFIDYVPAQFGVNEGVMMRKV